MRDMAIMKGLNGVESFKYSEKNRLSKVGFFTSGAKIKSKSLNSQRQTSVVEQEQTKSLPKGRLFVSGLGVKPCGAVLYVKR